MIVPNHGGSHAPSQGRRKITLFPFQLDSVQRIYFKTEFAARVCRAWRRHVGCVWKGEHIPDWGSAILSDQGSCCHSWRGVGDIIRHCGAGMGQPACLWSEGIKYSMKITPSLWLDSSYSYRIGEVIYFVVYPKHAYKKLLSNPKWDTAAAHGRAARPLLHSLAVMVTQPKLKRLGRGCVSTGEGWGEGPSVGRALFELIAVFEGVLFPLLKPAPWQEAAGRDGSHPCPWLCPAIPNPA